MEVSMLVVLMVVVVGVVVLGFVVKVGYADRRIAIAKKQVEEIEQLARREAERIKKEKLVEAKDEIFNFRCCCSIEQIDRSRDVVFCIFFRLCHRLSRSFQGCHVDD